MQQLSQYVVTQKGLRAKDDAAGFIVAPQDHIYGGYAQMGSYIDDDAPGILPVAGVSVLGLQIPWWLIGVAGIVGYMYAAKKGPFAGR